MGIYRKNAAIVVFRSDKKVLLCQRKDCYGKSWQFPQGGIDNGETPLDAAFRELREETSVVSVSYVDAYPEPLRYDFPPEIKIKNKRNGIHNDGQEQFWFLMRFDGTEDEINLQTEEPEFCRYKWVDIESALDCVVAFKYDVYCKVVADFKRKLELYKF